MSIASWYKILLLGQCQLTAHCLLWHMQCELIVALSSATSGIMAPQFPILFVRLSTVESVFCLHVHHKFSCDEYVMYTEFISTTQFYRIFSNIVYFVALL